MTAKIDIGAHIGPVGNRPYGRWTSARRAGTVVATPFCRRYPITAIIARMTQPA